MTTLFKKIERHFGLLTFQLPEILGKDHWDEIIIEETIPTFSRYFPYAIPVLVDNRCEKDGWYFIDKCLPAGTKILGVKDIDWEAYRVDPNLGEHYGMQFDTYDFVSREYAIEDVAFSQMSADFQSLFNLGIYIEWLPPNKIKLVSVNGSTVSRYRPFPIVIFIEHPANLMTISPTMMETFEDLAHADIARFLYEQLKFYDNTDTVYANLDLKLDTLQGWVSKRDDIIRTLDEAHTTTANEFQSMIMTV